MGLDAYVEMYSGGIIPIREFATMPMTKDILVRIIVKKSPVKIVYMSQRNTKTDFPVLTLAMSKLNGEYLCVIGARPLKAIALMMKIIFWRMELLKKQQKNLLKILQNN